MNFVIIGVGGYVAPRHLAAIKSVGGNLLAALDKNDSVGILDSYFPECDFFTEFEIFDRHVTMLLRSGVKIDYVVVCSPNYLHDAHCRFGLRIGADVICEKPLCLYPKNIDALEEIERETGRRIWNILQLRLHPVVLQMRECLGNTKEFVDLTYIASRGKWYDTSWKGDVNKSGGVCMNIGVHFFDMLLSVFGPCSKLLVHSKDSHTVSGELDLQNALVRWMLSVDKSFLPSGSTRRNHRSLRINHHEVDFTDGFENLHNKSYEQIIAGRGFGISSARAAIELVYQINKS